MMLLSTLICSTRSKNIGSFRCFFSLNSGVTKRLFARGNRGFTQYARLFKFRCRNTQAKEVGREPSSQNLFFSFFLGGSLVAGGKIFFSNAVLCEAPKPQVVPIEHDRLEGSESGSESDVDPPFDWSRFWKLLKPQLLNFIGAVLSALVVALINIQIPSLLGELVNIVAKFGSPATPDQDSSSFLTEVMTPANKIFNAYLIQAVFTFIYITFLTRMGERMAADLRRDLFQSLLKQDIAFYDKHKAGELVNRLTSDVQDFKSSFKMCISQGMRSVTQILGCGIAMYEISPQMSAWAALVVPSIIAIGAALGGLLRSISKEAQQQVGLSTAVADESLSNMRTVRAFAMEPQELQLFSREVEKSRHLNELLGTGIGVFQAGANLFLNGVILGTLYLGGKMISSGEVQPGDLMSFLVSAQTIQKSLGQLTILWGTYVRGISAGARVFEYINIEPTIPLKGGSKIPSHSLMGDVEFRNTSFTYPTRPDHEVLKDFSLKIPACKVVAIVGASGGGKSTLAQLLERFYDVTSGSVEIDGHDIRTLDPSWLRGELIGFINQEPVLFATSILENIRYGRPNATNDEVFEAARVANAHGFIEAFPAGYNTIVGERGVTVSGGQKQRIAIARTILKNPTILILDEATSALDAESEAVVQKALEKCTEGRTTVVIAHRLSTIQNADIIAVVRDGHLAELGTHEALKKKGGLYAELIRQQQQKEGK